MAWLRTFISEKRCAGIARKDIGEHLLWDAAQSHPTDSGIRPALHPTPAHKTGQEEKSAKQKEGKASITNPKGKLTKLLLLIILNLIKYPSRHRFGRRVRRHSAMKGIARAGVGGLTASMAIVSSDAGSHG